MMTVDVPMYYSRWQLDTAMGVEYLSIFDGLLDTGKSCIVNFDWTIWREEIPWMTLYFSVAAWISLALPHAPVITSNCRTIYKPN